MKSTDIKAKVQEKKSKAKSSSTLKIELNSDAKAVEVEKRKILKGNAETQANIKTEKAAIKKAIKKDAKTLNKD